MVFDDMIVDMEANKKLSPIVTELLIWGKKHNKSKLNAMHYFIMKIPKKREF